MTRTSPGAQGGDVVGLPTFNRRHHPIPRTVGAETASMAYCHRWDCQPPARTGHAARGKGQGLRLDVGLLPYSRGPPYQRLRSSPGRYGSQSAAVQAEPQRWEGDRWNWIVGRSRRRPIKADLRAPTHQNHHTAGSRGKGGYPGIPTPRMHLVPLHPPFPLLRSMSGSLL